MSEPCQIIFAATGATCGEDAAGLYRGACVHGHVSERWLCDEHAAKSHDCTACYRAGHVCAVTLELLDRAAMPGQPRYRPCCIHCEHDGESDPDLDHERHPNPCTEGCRA